MLGEIVVGVERPFQQLFGFCSIAPFDVKQDNFLLHRCLRFKQIKALDQQGEHLQCYCRLIPDFPLVSSFIVFLIRTDLVIVIGYGTVFRGRRTVSL